MSGEEIVMFCAPDLVGFNRGRSFPLSDLKDRMTRGLVLPPVVMALTGFGDIAAGEPWGPMGDVALIGDPEAEVRVDLGEGVPPLHFFMADWYTLDGKPWEGCARNFLKNAVADLEKDAGLRIRSGVEHEFNLAPVSPAPGPPFSLSALRVAAKFGSEVLAALKQAGQERETFEPEYGGAQYEIACRPALGVAGADRVAIVREVVREVARRAGVRATFTPLAALDAVGNGVHTHFSLEDVKGKPVSYDPARPGHMSALFGSFLAGLLRHLPALCAITTPSPVSYLRLLPGRWSSSCAAVGVANREVALRLPPVWSGAGGDPARSFNAELRPVDGTSCPHLVLAVVIRAGLEGIREKLPAPALLNKAPAQCSESELAAAGAQPLPKTLSDALHPLEQDKTVRSWFPKVLWDAFLAVKRHEIHRTERMEPAELAETYRSIY